MFQTANKLKYILWMLVLCVSCALCGLLLSSAPFPDRTEASAAGNYVVWGEVTQCPECGAEDGVGGHTIELIYNSGCGYQFQHWGPMSLKQCFGGVTVHTPSRTNYTATSSYCADVRISCTKCSVYYYQNSGNTARRQHYFGSYEQTKAPTCTSAGTEVASCSFCSYEKSRSVASLGHNYTVISTKSATCTEDGYTTSSCTRCHDEKTTTISALGHSYSGKTYSATCTSRGYTKYTCVRCNDSYNTNYTSALGHSYRYTQTKAPTCTASGTETGKCSRCSATTTRSIAALGHDLEEHAAKAATCTEAGWDAYETCSRCEYTTYEEIAARGHLPGAAATCTMPQTCSVCGTELQAALGHDLEEHAAKAATCTEAGWDAYETCSRCEYTTYEEIAARGHSPGTAATCTMPQTCSVCGAELQAALGHDVRILAAVPATCTQTGLSEGAQCSRCGEVLVSQTVLPALGHLLLAAEDSRVSCTDSGILTRRCARCDHVETSEVAGGIHSWRNVGIVREPTCSETGLRIVKCAFCDATRTVEIPCTAHKLILVKEVPPTCTEPGRSIGIVCAVCGEVLYARGEIPVMGHDLVHVGTVAPTETENGVMEHWRCVDCGALFADEHGGKAVSEAELRIPATGAQDIPVDGGETPGMAWWQILFAVAAGVVAVGAIAAVVVTFGRMR